MGQTQLMYLVLGLVIVGVAIIVGINAYTESSRKTNYDALLEDVLRIAGDAQLWKRKPELFGGQVDALKHDHDNFAGAIFSAWGYSQHLVGDGTTGEGTCYSNLNGVFDIASAGDGGILITAASAQHENQTQVFVNGIIEPNLFLGSSTSGVQPGDLCMGGADVLGGGECNLSAVTNCAVGS